MAHVVLLGDSVFDNGAYIGGREPDLTAQVQKALGPLHDVTRLATDGHTTAEMAGQIEAIPDGATHLVVSVGGNDALGVMPVLSTEVGTVAAALEMIAEAVAGFDAAYGEMITALQARDLRLAVCTIYRPRFDAFEETRIEAEAAIQIPAEIGLAAYNDAILRRAVAARLPVVDLRVLFDDVADYANPIEPSAVGGAKLATAIARLVRSVAFDAPWACVVGSPHH